MTTPSAYIKSEKSAIANSENAKGAANHRKIASQLEAAAKHHLEAAKHHEAGEHEKAALSTITAHGYLMLASKSQRKDIMNHAKNHES